MDVINGQVKRTYQNDFAINALAFSPDGKTLASGIENGKMVVWNTLSHKELISQPKAHAYKINVLVFSPDGKMLASGAPDKKVRLWNTQSGKKVGEAAYEREVLAVTFSADGQELTVGDRSGRIARSKTAEVMNAKPQHTQPLIAQQNRQNTSPRRGRFQNRSQQNLTKEKEQNSSVSHSKPAALYDKIEALNSRPVYTVTFVSSDDNRTYLLGQKDSFILPSSDTSDTPIKLSYGSVGNVVSAAFSPSIGYAMARSNDSTVWLVDLSGKFKKSPGLGHDFDVNVVAFSPDRVTLAVGTANGVTLWNAPKTEPLPKNQQPKALGATNTLAFSPDGRMLAIGKKTGTIQLWDLSANTNLKNLPPPSNYAVKSLAFSPDSKTLAVARSMSREIERWNILNSQKLLSLKTRAELLSLKLDNLVGHTDNMVMVNTVKFSPDGKTLASGDSGGKVLLWDVQTGAEIDPIQRYNTKYPQSKDKYIRHEDAVLSVAFSDDGNTLKSADATGAILLWNLSTIDITSNPNQILAYNEQQKTSQNANRQQAEISDQDSKQHTATATVTRKPVPKTVTRDDTESAENTEPRLPATSDFPIVLDEFDSSVKANVSSYVLSGKVDAKNGPFKVKINNTDAEMLQDGQHFEGSVELNEGTNPIIIVATDKNGESLRRNIEIERKPKPDRIGPVIAPDYESTVGRTTRTTIIKGTVEDDKSGVAKVEINGKEAKIEFSSTTDHLIGTFQREVTLDEGDNQFTITATDNSTKKTEETITIRREPTPPVIKVTNPQLDTSAKTAKIWKDTVEIKVEVTDESGVAEVKSDGGLGPALMSLESRLNKGGVYASTYDHLTEEPIVNFTITAKDTKGVTASEQIVINFAKDEIKPIILSSMLGTVNRKTVYIRAKVTDAQTGIKDVKLVKPDGQEVTLTPNRDGEISHLVKLHEGANIFKIFATDAMDNTAEKDIPIHRVPAPPSIEVISPRYDRATNTATISQGHLEVTVRVTDEESDIKSVKIDGQNATTQDGIIFKRVVNVRTPGMRTIKIEAEDTAGGEKDTSFKVAFQEPKPLDSQSSTPVSDPAPADVSSTLPDATLNQKREENSPDVTFSNPDLRYKRPCEVNEDEFVLIFEVFDESKLPDKIEIKRVLDTWDSEVVKYANKIDKSGELEFRYEARLPLHEGQNNFEMTVMDQWRNRTPKEFTIVKRQVDNQGPDIDALQIVGSNGQPILLTGNATRVVEEQITLSGVVSDRSGVKSLEVNGEPVQPAADGKFETKIFLNYAKNEIIIKAIDGKGTPNEEKREITKQFDRTSKDFALFFAIDEYLGKKDIRGNWTNLEGTTLRDAEAVAENLQDNYGFKTKIFPNPTKRELIDTIYKYRKDFDGIKYTEGSQLLLFFSGHGYYSPENGKGYLIAADTDSPSLDPPLYTALAHDTLRSEIELIECPRLLVLLDTCYSGTFDPNFKPLPGPKGLLDETEMLKMIKQKLGFEARWCLTAAGQEKVLSASGEDGKSVSPFTKAFLNALNTKGGDDFLLTLDEVWEEIEKSKDDPIYEKLIEAQSRRRF